MKNTGRDIPVRVMSRAGERGILGRWRNVYDE